MALLTLSLMRRKAAIALLKGAMLSVMEAGNDETGFCVRLNGREYRVSESVRPIDVELINDTTTEGQIISWDRGTATVSDYYIDFPPSTAPALEVTLTGIPWEYKFAPLETVTWPVLHCIQSQAEIQTIFYTKLAWLEQLNLMNNPKFGGMQDLEAQLQRGLTELGEIYHKISSAMDALKQEGIKMPSPVGYVNAAYHAARVGWFNTMLYEVRANG
jgi:hypothetical protein